MEVNNGLESALSILYLMPSNESEVTSFKENIKRSILTSPDCLDVLKQLHWCLRTISECMEDPQIHHRMYLECLTHGTEIFQHKGNMFEISLDNEDIRIEL